MRSFFVLLFVLVSFFYLVISVNSANASAVSMKFPVEPTDNLGTMPAKLIQISPTIPIEPVEFELTYNCSCSSCAECEAKLNNQSCNEVVLNTNIFNHQGNCIYNPENFNYKTFDCNNHQIIGSGGYEGIYLENKIGNTIKNCKISNFSHAIFLSHVSYSFFERNELTNNGIGMYMVYSDNNEIRGNIANYNTDGFYLMSSSNNSISNNTAKNNIYHGITIMGFSDYFSEYNLLSSNVFENNSYAGIYLQSWANYNILENNSVILNEEGIAIYSSHRNEFYNNYAAYNNKGISLYSSPSSVFRENILENNGFNFYITGYEKEHYLQNIDASNIVDGKPVYYYDGNCNNLNIPDGAGMLVLISCKNVTIKNLEIKHNSPGMILVEVNDSFIYNNVFENNGEGILLFNSSKNSIKNNNFISNSHSVFSMYSTGNFIEENSFNSDVFSSIYLSSSSNNNFVKENRLEAGRTGIIIIISNSNKLLNNFFSSFSNYGILLYASNDNEIKNNVLENNANGVLLIEGSSHNFFENNIVLSNIENGMAFMYNSNNNKVLKSHLDSYKGIFISQSFNNFVEDSKIISENYSIEMDYVLSNLSLVNVSFDKTKVQIGDGNLYVKWYLDVYVNDTNGNPQQGAMVTIKDVFNNEQNFITGQNGFIPRQVVNEYYQDAYGKYYINFYKIMVSKPNFLTIVKDVNIQNNTFITATLERVASNVKKDILY
ncbi:MAG: right-handed parallel beta-helix repeat-containing protein [Candidatus Pacearchaeota archaeon]|nr:right-handed parallel beta-helix repeat-containing protein [Candidatus Pacearchaeota archaeon]